MESLRAKLQSLMCPKESIDIRSVNQLVVISPHAFQVRLDIAPISAHYQLISISLDLSLRYMRRLTMFGIPTIGASIMVGECRLETF